MLARRLFRKALPPRCSLAGMPSFRWHSSESRVPHHSRDDSFISPWASYTDHTILDFFVSCLPQWNWRTRKAIPQELVDMNWERIRKPSSSLQVSWLGHATFLIQMDGLTFLTDPVFSERCSPVQFAGPRRFTAVPCEIEDLPPIDAVLLSHTHYDHLDRGSVRRLLAKEASDIHNNSVGFRGTQWITPLRVGNMLTRSFGVSPERVEELDWWGRTGVSDVQVVATPAQHHTGRGLFDRNQALWCGFALLSPSNRFYFSGDTGYRGVPHGVEEGSPAFHNLPVCPAFREIGDTCVFVRSRIIGGMHWEYQDICNLRVGAWGSGNADWAHLILRASRSGHTLRATLCPTFTRPLKTLSVFIGTFDRVAASECTGERLHSRMRMPGNPRNACIRRHLPLGLRRTSSFLSSMVSQLLMTSRSQRNSWCPGRRRRRSRTACCVQQRGRAPLVSCTRRRTLWRRRCH